MAELLVPHDAEHDLVIIGAGPAGLSSAINASSEHLNTKVLDGGQQLGGQARTSTLIENYPGFPAGITGENITSRMVSQAVKFGTEFFAPVQASRIESTDKGGLVIFDDDNEAHTAGAGLIASGVSWRKLKARNIAAFLGRGVAYGSPDGSMPYDGHEITLVGGGNSAGQAAMHLSKFEGTNVHMVVRGKSLEETMSYYLLDRIVAQDNIHVYTETEVETVEGERALEQVIVNNKGNLETLKADKMFVLIGSEPKTGWLPPGVARDERGYVLAGIDLPDDTLAEFKETEGRSPLPHETSVPGLFVAGDVRANSVKRVVSASGDGGTTVPEIYRYLAPEAQ